MREIKTIDVDRYEPAEDNIHLKHVGMKSGYEVFDLLEAHLSSVGLLPDEYFSLSPYFKGEDELPVYSEAICHTNWGGSEGIYIDIILKYRDNGKSKEIPFAIGKTLGESGDDFIRMSRIAAECSMMLNGRGGFVKVPEQSYPKEPDSLYIQTETPTPTLPKDDYLDIYQIKAEDPEIRNLLFRNYDFCTRHNHPIHIGNYNLVYSGSMDPGETLDDIYYRFNCDHPADFKGHSLSISDVVALHKNGETEFYFTDTIGFKSLPDFLKEPQKATNLDEQIRVANAKSSSIPCKPQNLER